MSPGEVNSIDTGQDNTKGEEFDPFEPFADSELIIALVGAVGTDVTMVTEIIANRLRVSKYEVHTIKISRDVINELAPEISANAAEQDEYSRIKAYMDAGDDARRKTGDPSILALGAARTINKIRARILNVNIQDIDNAEDVDFPAPLSRHAFIIDSLKHPDEVRRLREIYPKGVLLLAVYASKKTRKRNLVDVKRLTASQADELINRDADDSTRHGQHTRDTFQLADYFIHVDGRKEVVENTIWRFLAALLSDPYQTPTFDEYAMFFAFSAALRSADLSRQVGAVIAKGNEIIAMGANDCPRFGGGLYWPKTDPSSGKIYDEKGGRDCTHGFDANKAELNKMVGSVVALSGLSGPAAEAFSRKLSDSSLGDITEYGRVVHAEMDALLTCARMGVSARGATLYCTTFPCHNCAKHLVAAGIRRVVYVEPYPKSKAEILHADSISLGFPVREAGKRKRRPRKVAFEPFVGVGPRKFFDLFSMKLGSGIGVKRKTEDGNVVKWLPETGQLRTPMMPVSYLEIELAASRLFQRHVSNFLQ